MRELVRPLIVTLAALGVCVVLFLAYEQARRAGERIDKLEARVETLELERAHWTVVSQMWEAINRTLVARGVLAEPIQLPDRSE